MRSLARVCILASLLGAPAAHADGIPFATAIVNVDGAAMLVAPWRPCAINRTVLDETSRSLLIECESFEVLEFKAGIPQQEVYRADAMFQGWTVRLREIGGTSELRFHGCDLLLTGAGMPLPAPYGFAMWHANCGLDHVHANGFE